jgi:hypothetical protein
VSHTFVTAATPFVTDMSPRVTSRALRHPAGGFTVAAMAALGLALTLIVRLYDTASLSDSDRTAAVETASAILLASSVPTSWPDCHPPRPAPKGHAAFVCERPLGSGEVAIRVLRDATSSAPTSARAVARDAPRELPLGYSLVDVREGGGALATIYLDRVERIADESGVPASVILGRAIAHEIGHLLLGNTRHSRQGLMREVWSHVTLTHNHYQDWVFTSQEGVNLRAALEKRMPAAQEATNIVWGTR